jgi:hypothetical protein
MRMRVFLGAVPEKVTDPASVAVAAFGGVACWVCCCGVAGGVWVVESPPPPHPVIIETAHTAVNVIT